MASLRTITNGTAMISTSSPIQWMVDTGSGTDLVGRKTLGAEVTIHKDEKPVSLSTANGSIPVTDVVNVRSKVLRETVQPKVLEHSPPAISIGDRCLNKGWSFHWPPYDDPYMVDADGRINPIRSSQ